MSDQTVTSRDEVVEEREQDKANVVKQPYEQRTLKGGAVTIAAMGIVDVISHMGLTGLVFGGIVSYAVYRHGPEVAAMIDGEIGIKELAGRIPWTRKHAPRNSRTFWQKAWNIQPQHVAVEEEEAALDEESATPAASPAEIFTEEAQEETVQMERITVEDAVLHLARNSYTVYVGRSLTDDIGRAKKIGIAGKHLKFIGASQRGKSSEIAALISQLADTHDPTHVQFAILDLEDKTGRLFADLPHIKCLKIDGNVVRLYARNADQVLQYLIYLHSYMEMRYRLSAAELEAQPLLIVYLEEFLRLRRMLKARIAAAPTGSARERAQRDYGALLESIDGLAARGLKAKIQLWLAAQVDYVDEDLREALSNVMEGMSFCVRTSAAAAAGFTRSDLIAANRRTNRVGQAVVETTDMTDLIQAVEYDLGARLRAFPDRFQVQPERKQGNTLETPMETAIEANPGYTGNVSETANDTNELSTDDGVLIGNEIRETVKRLRQRGLPLREIAPLVGMAGRKYEQFKRLCEEEDLA